MRRLFLLKEIRKDYTPHPSPSPTGGEGIVFLSIFLFFLSLSFSAPLHAQDDYLRVSAVKGSVAILPEGSRRASPARKNMVIKKGDRIVTGKNSSAELNLKEGTVLELKEETSLEFQDLSGQVRSFFLKAGSMWGRFKSKFKREPAYRIGTPVSVASVRGTDLAITVTPEGETHAGVVEGEVEFGPAENLPEKVKEEWEENASAKNGEGMVIQPDGKPEKTSGLPPLVVSSLDWFDHVRDRVKTLDEEWKDLDLRSSENLRAETLRETIDWEIPAHLNIEFKKPPSLRDTLPDLKK